MKQGQVWDECLPMEKKEAYQQQAVFLPLRATIQTADTVSPLHS